MEQDSAGPIRQDFSELDRPALEAAAVALGQPAFRGRQIFQWIHQRDVCDFQAMTDVPADVRARLAADAVITEPALETKQVSADGTTKFLLRLADGRHFEAVYIPDTPNQTFCVSTQVGCAMACGFCLTGKMGLVRNLTAGEIVGQVRVLARETGLRGSPFNIVLMGMGEPLHFQIYAVLALAFLLTLTVISFIRRSLTAWLGIGLFWVLGFVAILVNVFGFGEVIWQSGNFALTRERLLPTWAMLGWIVFTLGGFFSVRSVHNNSRPPLLRNRLNYWTPVFLLVFINDGLIMAGFPFPGSPIRLAAAVLSTFIIVTHGDPPDLRDVARRVMIYLITSLVIIGFYVAGFTASQTAFEALPTYSPLLVGAAIPPSL